MEVPTWDASVVTTSCITGRSTATPTCKAFEGARRYHKRLGCWQRNPKLVYRCIEKITTCCEYLDVHDAGIITVCHMNVKRRPFDASTTLLRRPSKNQTSVVCPETFWTFKNCLAYEPNLYFIRTYPNHPKLHMQRHAAACSGTCRFFLQSMTVDGNQPNSIGNAICMNVSKWPSYPFASIKMEPCNFLSHQNAGTILSHLCA